MANSYSNAALAVHGPTVAKGTYTEEPDIYLNISTGSIQRIGNTSTIQLEIQKAILSAVNGLSYFGYSFLVYASLDNSNKMLLLEKPVSPNQWDVGDYSMSNAVTLQSTNATATATLKIWAESSCTCNSGAADIVFETPLEVAAMKNGIIWIRENGVWVKKLFPHKYSSGTWTDLGGHKNNGSGWSDMS